MAHFEQNILESFLESQTPGLLPTEWEGQSLCILISSTGRPCIWVKFEDTASMSLSWSGLCRSITWVLTPELVVNLWQETPRSCMAILMGIGWIVDKRGSWVTFNVNSFPRTFLVKFGVRLLVFGPLWPGFTPSAFVVGFCQYVLWSNCCLGF